MIPTTTTAAAYFEGHPRGTVWAAFEEPKQAASLTHARRIVQRSIREDITDADLDALTDSDFPRLDFAIFEQALWQLENSPQVGDGDGEAPRSISRDPEAPDKVRDAQTAVLAPEAARWMFNATPRGAGFLTLERG